MKIDFSFKDFCEQSMVPGGMFSGIPGARPQQVDPGMVQDIMRRFGGKLQQMTGWNPEQLQEILTKAPQFVNAQNPQTREALAAIETEVANSGMYDLPPGMRMGASGFPVLLHILGGAQQSDADRAGASGGHAQGGAHEETPGYQAPGSAMGGSESLGRTSGYGSYSGGRSPSNAPGFRR